jgi:hypothetical protein
MFIYYVYAYLRSDGTPYYIGKGKKSRAFDNHKKIPVPKDQSRIVFLETDLSEIGAFALERRYIRWYGRKNLGTGILRNMTDGGDGSSGVIISEEQKKKISEALTGKKHSKETRRKMSLAQKGKRKKYYSWNKGQSLCLDHRTKISEARIGIKFTEEHKKKLQEAQRQRFINNPYALLKQILIQKKGIKKYIKKTSLSAYKKIGWEKVVDDLGFEPR